MEYKQYTVKIDRDACVGCGVCVRNCPTYALFIRNNDQFVTFNKELCGACGACTEVNCPTGALEVE